MLKREIGVDARLVTRLIGEHKELSIAELQNLTGYREAYINLVLGWLLKEDKILYKEKDDGLYIQSNENSKK